MVQDFGSRQELPDSAGHQSCSTSALLCNMLIIFSKLLVQDIVTHNGHPYFINVLREQADGPDAVSLTTQAQAVFVLTMICDGYPLGQQRCLEAGLLQLLISHMEQQNMIMSSHMHDQSNVSSEKSITENLLLLKWTLLALGKLFENQPSIVHTSHDQYDAIKKLKVHCRLCSSLRCALLSKPG
jgi:hypothetical protein